MKTKTNPTTIKRTQFDGAERVVALSNLEAMCDRVSGTCRCFSVVKVTTNSVHVQYSNPNEYGSESPVTAIYPTFRNQFDGADNPFVVLHATNYLNDKNEAWQSFCQLTDCEPLYRVTWEGEWKTRFEIMVDKHPEFAVTSSWDSGGCIQTWHCKENSFISWRNAQAWAVKEMETLQTAQTVNP